MRARRAGFASVAVAAALSLGCVGRGVVDRVYGGTVVRGWYIPPEAYAAFLRAAIAEADGRTTEAIVGYADAARLDPVSPEPWTRMADLTCRAGGRPDDALAELEHAQKLDPAYAPAWEVQARCLLSVGRTAEAEAARARLAALDPRAGGESVLLSRLGTSALTPGERDALLAATRAAPDPVVAWDTLAGWARVHGDVTSWETALRELVRLAPERRSAVARSAEELAGLGALGPARAVAAAAADASDAPLPHGALAARLAVDEAIARGQGSDVRTRATRARVGLEETAARALLAGDHGLACSLGAEVAAADGTARGARLVVALCSRGDLLAAASDVRRGDAPVSAPAFVAFGWALARVVTPAAARAALATIAHEPVVTGDDRTVRAAVELVSRGALPADELPPDGAVELTALGGVVVLPNESPLDPRHEYLALALAHPEAARTRELGARLAALGGDDPLVASAAALVRLAAGRATSSDARTLLARNPADPVLAATALRLAEKSGDADVARQARETLAALGGRRPGVE